MAKFVALLRGINVGGNRIVKMDELARMFAGMGFSGVRTYIQSGNIIFESGVKNETSLTRTIEDALRKKLGYAVRVCVRSAADLARIAALDPFAREKLRATGKYYVTFLCEEPEAERVKSLLALANEAQRYHVAGREVWALFDPDPRKNLRLAANPLEKVLGVSGTTRNRNVVGEIVELLNGAPQNTSAQRAPRKKPRRRG